MRLFKMVSLGVIGLLVGYFAAWPIIVGLTFISILVLVYLMRELRLGSTDTREIVLFLYTLTMGFFIIPMWAAFGFATCKGWLWEFAHLYILRN